MNLSWDGVKGDREILIRKMLYEDPRKVVKEYDKEVLRKTFLEFIHRFDRINRSFWSLILDISDEEIARASASNFREACRIWDY